MYTDHIISKEEHSRFLESLKNDDGNFYWLVKDRTCERGGVIYLNKLNLRLGHAYLGIYANLFSKLSQKGEMLIKVLFRLAFGYANLHTLKSKVLEDNLRAINLYRRLGFKKEGTLKEFIFRDGRWKDVIIMGITNKDALEKYKMRGGDEKGQI